VELLSHKQNGEVVLEYHLWTDEWNELVKNSKFPELNPEWHNVPKEGYIASRTMAMMYGSVTSKSGNCSSKAFVLS
jgi:hypothetical protein